MLIIGRHVGFKKDTQLLGALDETLSYNGNAFMFYTGAPQNTVRMPLNDDLTFIDTPGFIEEDNISNFVSGKELKKILYGRKKGTVRGKGICKIRGRRQL